jgi:GNAT superfamily N-acetyltransferase
MPTNSFQIRRAATGDEPVLRTLRMQALSESPEAFGSTLDREVARSTADWQRWLSPSATCILETATGPMGLAAGVPDAADPDMVSLMAMWVHPDLRGSGAADMLIDAVLAWAEAVGAHLIRLDVIQGNDRARRVYERHQFRPIEGSGAKVRSVTLKAASDLDHGDIQALFKAAIKHSGVTFPRTRSTRVVIKSESKKPRPRRTGHA